MLPLIFIKGIMSYFGGRLHKSVLSFFTDYLPTVKVGKLVRLHKVCPVMSSAVAICEAATAPQESPCISM